MLHVCVMHISMMRQFCHGRTNQRWSWHACVWCMYSWCGIFVMHVQTSTLMHIYIMHVCIMHIHMLLDHVCTMHIHMLLDNDAYVHDAYFCDIQSLTMLHVCVWCGWFLWLMSALHSSWKTAPTLLTIWLLRWLPEESTALFCPPRIQLTRERKSNM